MSFELPYFDQILEAMRRQPDSQLSAAFERHVHWGYYEHPEGADDSVAGYVAAAERMTQQICAAAGVADGLRILDVGCGFGGTIHALNERLSNCELTGLNIDERQLVRARGLVHATSGNTVRFVQGDACVLPFEDDSYDVVLAVECAFHFPSRKRFFLEARRVLAAGGTIALSDFVAGDAGLDAFSAWVQSGEMTESDFYGANKKPLSPVGYERMARGAGFEILANRNVTSHTMPTYPAMHRLYRDAGLPDGEAATDYLEETARRQFVEYRILAFEAAEKAVPSQAEYAANFRALAEPL